MPRYMLVIIALAVALLAVGSASGADDPFGFSEDAYSTWGIDSAPYPYDPTELGAENDYGCFPVGNGFAFGHLGVDADFTTLRGLIGPGYQSRSVGGGATYWLPGEWPDMRVSVLAVPASTSLEETAASHSAAELDWSSQGIHQLRGAAMVRTVQRNHSSDFFTLTYAVPGERMIVTEAVVFGVGDGQEPVLAVDMDGKGFDFIMADGMELAVVEGHTRVVRLAALTAGTRQHFHPEGTLYVRGEPDEWHGMDCHRFSVAYRFYPTAADVPADGGPYPGTAQELRELAYSHWQDFSAGNRRFDTGVPRLDDMMTQLPVIIEAQRDHYCGGTAPMVSYHGYWVRDSNGPMLTYLENRRYDIVKQMLRYHRAACLTMGFCYMLVPMDMDVSGLEGWQPGEPGTAGELSAVGTKASDWEGMGVEHAEVPSTIVLQHYWLWREMRETGMKEEADAFIREAWAFINHNLNAMHYHPEYGVNFHGDETYTQGSLYSSYDREESGQIGYPNGYIPTQDYCSFDNTILHRAAASAIIEMGAAIGTDDGINQAVGIRDDMDCIINDAYYANSYYYPAISRVTGQRWKPPFAHINLRPYWLGLDYGELNTHQNYTFIRDVLWRKGGPYPCTTPWSGYMTGHNLGYWLHGATNQLDGYTAGEVVRMLIETANPEGAWCEVLRPNGLPVDIYGRTNRIRPWESGINYVALAEFLDEDGVWSDLGPFFNQGEAEPQFTMFDGIGARALVLTTRHDWREYVLRDHRIAELVATGGLVDQDGNQIDPLSAWDAALPFTPDDLRQALKPRGMSENWGVNYLIFDRGVRGGLDRRTMKDEDFWYGSEMEAVLAEFEANGGTVIDEDSIEVRLADDEAVALKMLLVLFPNTFTHQMDAAEIENFHLEMGEWVSWFEASFGDRIKLEIDYMQSGVELSPLMSGPQGEGVYWMGHADVEDHLLRRGVAKDEYDAVACFWAWDRDVALPGGEKARQAYGGAAQGPAAGMEFLGQAGGTSYFGAAVLADRPDGPSKLISHEFLHNVDAMFEMVGVPEVWHTDHMSLEMENLLAEVPGAFEKWGYSDDDMRAMVEAELANEIHYPWETQLVFYERAVQRVPHDECGQLLTHFGRRVKQEPRTRLYDGFILPAGVTPYQVYLSPPLAGDELAGSGVKTYQRDDYDFTNTDTLIWQGELYAGSPVQQESVKQYNEAYIQHGEPVYNYTCGVTEPLSFDVWGSDGEALGGAVDARWDIDGQWNDFMWGVGDASLIGTPPFELGPRHTLTITAEKEGYAISPYVVELRVKPVWELDITPTDGALTLALDGPAGEYLAQLDYARELNTVQQMLVADGLLVLPEVRAEVELTPGSAVDVPVAAGCSGETLPLAIAVDYTDERGNEFTFHHRSAGNAALAGAIADALSGGVPDYVPVAHPHTGAGGAVEYDIRLDPATGNNWARKLDGPADAALDLRIEYDRDYLYLYGRATDDQPMGDGTWVSERINLVFDALLDSTPASYPHGAVGHTGWLKDDYWVFLNPILPDGPESMRLGGEKTAGQLGYFGLVDGAEADAARTADGYEFSWRLPFASLPYLSGKSGQVVGFSLFMSDFDGSLAELMYVTDWGAGADIEWRMWDCGLLYFEP